MKLSETLLIEILRGNLAESEHICDAVVVNAAGFVTMAWGEQNREIYARSAIKPVQALPLVESGAADHFNFSDGEIALACASHNSETEHIKGITDVLARIGLAESDLECGPHRPYDEPTSDELVRHNIKPGRVHNNCSGKHMGFLCTAVHLGENPAGYIHPTHPVQKRIRDTMAEMSGCDLSQTTRGTDGCGIPVIGMALSGLARAMARMADPTGLGTIREASARRIVTSMMAHPDLVAGKNRLDTLAMKAIDGVALKTGAEGVQVAIVPEHGLGIAIKARDGNKRASEVAALWVLRELGLISESASVEITDLLEPPISNTLGQIVGSIRVREAST